MKMDFERIDSYCQRGASQLSKNDLGGFLADVVMPNGGEAAVTMMFQFFAFYIGLKQNIFKYINVVPTLGFANTNNLRGVNFVIPKNVKTVGGGIFQYADVNAVDFDADVNALPDSTFAGSKVKEVKVGEGIQVIADNAFEDCKQLQVVTLPASVRKIAKTAFAGCNPDVTIQIPEAALDYLTIEGYDQDAEQDENGLTGDALTDFYNGAIEVI